MAVGLAGADGDGSPGTKTGPLGPVALGAVPAKGRLIAQGRYDSNSHPLAAMAHSTIATETADRRAGRRLWAGHGKRTGACQPVKVTVASARVRRPW